MRQLLHTDELTGPPSPAASGQKIQADPDVIREVIKGFQDERNDIQVFIKQCEDLRQVHPPGEDGQSHGFLDPHHRLTPELRDYYLQVQQNYQAVIDNLQADLAGLQRTEDTNSRKFEGQL